MKLLLYCTKKKPYLVQSLAKPMHTLDVNNPYNFNWKLVNKGFSSNRLNGKVIAECDFEIEEIRKGWGCLNGTCYYRTSKGFPDLELERKSYLSYDELNDYLKGTLNEKSGYAISIKNLKIFDRPKDIVHYGTNIHYDDEGWTDTDSLWKAPSRMMEVYDIKWNNYVFIPMQPQELCRILNGEKTIIIRKTVLKDLLNQGGK